jgi:hypothetical protein
LRIDLARSTKVERERFGELLGGKWRGNYGGEDPFAFPSLRVWKAVLGRTVGFFWLLYGEKFEVRWVVDGDLKKKKEAQVSM